MKFWNVIASLAVLLVLVYTGACTAALLMDRVDFEAFKQAVLPVLTAVLGYMAAMLPKAGP